MAAIDRRTQRTKAGVGRAAASVAESPVAIVKSVRAGLPFRKIEDLEKASGLSREAVGRWIGMSPRTLARRKVERRLNCEESDRVVRAARVFGMAVGLFEGDRPAARQWLQTPQASFGGESPLEFATTDVGARAVEELIGRLEHGVFS